MKKITLTLAVLLTGVALVIFGAACNQVKPTIKLATQSPLSGGSAAQGEQIKLGAQLALEEQKAAFEALGFSLELAPYDDQANPDTGVANANRIINDNDILGVVGHYNSGVAIPSSEVYNRIGLVMVSPSNTNPKVTDRKLPNVNRICGRDDVQGPAGAEFAVKELNAKKIFVIHDKTTYGQGLAEAFRKAAVELGATIPDSAFVGTEEKANFVPLVIQIEAFKPDLVYFGGTYDQIGPFTKQLRERGQKIPVLGGDGLDASDYIKLAGGGANAANTYYTTVAGPVSIFPKAKDLAAKFKTEFSKDIEGYGIYGYDCAMVILNAIQASIKANGGKKPAPDAVAKAVRATDYDGMTGHITFDDKGDKAVAEYFILKYAGTENFSDNSVIKSISVPAPAATM